jgi:hypothetical protein
MATVSRIVPMHGFPGTRPGRDHRSGAADPVDLGYRRSAGLRGHQAVIARQGGPLLLAGRLRLVRGDEFAVSLLPGIGATRRVRAVSGLANQWAVIAEASSITRSAISVRATRGAAGGAANDPYRRLSFLKAVLHPWACRGARPCPLEGLSRRFPRLLATWDRFGAGRARKGPDEALLGRKNPVRLGRCPGVGASPRPSHSLALAGPGTP